MPELTTVRRVIHPADCDMLGHMNVARYFDLVSDGGFTIQAELGIDRQDMTDGRKLSFVVVRAESAFHSEILAGDRVYVRSGVIETGRKAATFQHCIFRSGDDRLCFETQFRTVLMSLERRRAVSIPDEIQQRMQNYMIEEKT
mgnify:CR=1 FL=1